MVPGSTPLLRPRPLKPRSVLARLGSLAKSDSTWVVVLWVISALLCAGAIVVFYPGGTNPDSIWQLQQTLGVQPISDWHPPILVITWKWLTAIFGTPDALLFAQVIIFDAAMAGFATIVYRLTSSRALSFCTALIPALPYVFTYEGMLWKDTQMVGALSVFVVAVLTAATHPKLTWPLCAIATVALTYGALVRKNAIPAIIPLAYLLYRAAFHRPGKRPTRRQRFREGILTAGTLVACVVGTELITGAIYHPIRTDQSSQIYLDDVVFTVSTDEIRDAQIPESLKTGLLEAQNKCRAKDLYEDAYWACYPRRDHEKYAAIDEADALRGLWLSNVATHPARYLEYRIMTFTHFMFDNTRQWVGKTLKNDLGFHTRNVQANDAGETYVNKMGDQLPWLFSGWFWLLASVATVSANRPILRLAKRSGLHGLYAWTQALALSSTIYIVTYFPVVPANHFRYLYWPAVAMTLVGALLASGYTRSRKNKHRPRDAHTGSFER